MTMGVKSKSQFRLEKAHIYCVNGNLKCTQTDLFMQVYFILWVFIAVKNRGKDFLQFQKKNLNK